MNVTGGCQCGAIRYSCEVDLDDINVCHCTNCQAQSASAFGISVSANGPSLKVTKGAPKTFEWIRDSGATGVGAFCSDCGTRLWNQTGHEDDNPSIKGGSLDEPVDISNGVHIWTSSKLPGVVIPDGVRSFPKEPE